MNDITLLQWVVIYFAGFIFCVLTFKVVDYCIFNSIKTHDYILDVMIMSLGWMVTIPLLIFIGFITLMYKLVKWLLNY
jgi:hypothetical protein